MNEIRSLADQLRTQIASPDIPPDALKIKEVKKNKSNALPEIHETSIFKRIQSYDNKDHKSMVHVRFDQRTSQLLIHFKMATNVDVTKLVAFAVAELFQNHPELKSIIKNYIHNLKL